LHFQAHHEFSLVLLAGESEAKRFIEASRTGGPRTCCTARRPMPRRWCLSAIMNRHRKKPAAGSSKGEDEADGAEVGLSDRHRVRRDERALIGREVADRSNGLGWDLANLDSDGRGGRRWRDHDRPAKDR
jgi:hypothetical protein